MTSENGARSPSSTIPTARMQPSSRRKNRAWSVSSGSPDTPTPASCAVPSSASGSTPSSFPSIPPARARGMGVVGMKVLARGLLVHPRLGVSAEEAIRYALGADVDAIVVGCDDVAQVEANVAAACLDPLTADERRRIEERIRPVATRLSYYRRPPVA